MSKQEHHQGEFVGRTTDVDHRHEDAAYGGLSSGEKAILTRRSHGDTIALPKGVMEDDDKMKGAKKYVKDHNLDSKKVFHKEHK